MPDKTRYSDLTPKQRDHLARIYLWIGAYKREYYWSEDASFASRTIKSLINRGLLNEYSEWAVSLTYRGHELGRSCFVRTSAYDEYAREIGYL